MGNTVGSLSNLERSIIIGSVLGDGYLKKIAGRSDAFLEINHSIKAKDYVDYKYNSLKRLCKSTPKIRTSNEGRVAYRFFTIQHPDLSELMNVFYQNGVKVIPNDLKLDPLMVAIWYMDDGSKSRDSDIYLNTQQFSVSEQKKIIVALRKFGVRARLNKDKKYYRVRILKEDVKIFMSKIEKYVTESMRYKLVMTL